MKRGKKGRVVHGGRLRYTEAPCEGIPLTSQDIYDALCIYGSIGGWAAATETSPDNVDICVAAWRRSVRPNTIDELARDLRRAGVHGGAIERATRRSGLPSKPWAPHVTRAEIEADAEHIKRWGYV